MSAFAYSFELLKKQCIQIVNEMTNQNYGSASSTGSHASSTGSHDSYTEHDSITEYPDYHSHETYGSDTEEQQSIDYMQRITDAMQALQCHEPDDDFANSALIIDLKKKLDSAWHFFDYSDQYLADINAARAASAWLLCTLLKANFAHQSGLVTELRNFKRSTEVNLQVIATAITDAHQQRKAMNDRIDHLHTLFSKLEVTISTPKKGFFWAKMPPETHTLPGLLAQLERPDTP
jgi:hypothetical protein